MPLISPSISTYCNLLKALLASSARVKLYNFRKSFNRNGLNKTLAFEISGNHRPRTVHRFKNNDSMNESFQLLQQFPIGNNKEVHIYYGIVSFTQRERTVESV